MSNKIQTGDTVVLKEDCGGFESGTQFIVKRVDCPEYPDSSLVEIPAKESFIPKNFLKKVLHNKTK